MARQGDYFKNQTAKLTYDKTASGFELHLNFKPIGEKLDRAQLALDTQVWEDVQKYMPIDTGDLIQKTNALNAVESGKVYLYPLDSEYGHYQYTGIVYVDPVYKVGAFYSPNYGFWSRPGVKKEPSDRRLTYSNPKATADWGQTAINNHLKDWQKVVRNALK
jgi:hypothetical protein